MAATPSETAILDHVRKLLASSAAAGLPDRELVERFAHTRDEQAFEALVSRHGPMVFRVCRRVLGRAHEAEDAFQATFLIFARKAASLRDTSSVSSWLYGVASRVARKARASIEPGPALPHSPATKAAGPLEELTLREARQALDEELARLPDKFRSPLILCCLEGRARDEAALELGLPFSTLKSRLGQARDLLRRRLSRRGLALPAVFSAALLTDPAVGALPGPLVRATARAATLFEAGKLTAEAPVTSGALALAQGTLNVMPTSKLAALAATALLALILAATGAAMRPSPAAAPPAAAATAPEPSARLTALARRLWAVTELVAKHHPEPPARADMLAAAATALAKEAKVTAPADLKRRAADVSSAGQLAALLKSVLPGGAPKKEGLDRLEAATLQGLLGSVPGGANLMSADDVRITGQLSANRYVGIGIQIALNEKAKRAIIVDPFRRGTAHRAGVKPGDLIERVDGKDTHGVPLMKVVQWLRGEEGTTVEIEVRQPSADSSRTYRITRAPVPFDTVYGYRRDGEEWRHRIDPSHPVGYVRLGNLTSSTLHELRQAERRLRAEGCRAVVLDLRFSDGGGELHPAQLVAGGLVDRRVLWRIRDARGGVKEPRSGSEALFRDWPMAVLINAETGSTAAQAVVASLQDSGRAVVVGERTRGEGFVNSLVPLPESGFSLVLRTGRLERTVKGRGWPVEPDHSIALDKSGASAVVRWLRGKERSEIPAGAERAPEDPQLARAVELLKAKAAKAGRGK
jgi:C-terminal peptidase prc